MDRARWDSQTSPYLFASIDNGTVCLYSRILPDMGIIWLGIQDNEGRIHGRGVDSTMMSFWRENLAAIRHHASLYATCAER
jgi:hypothetical protein